MWSWLRVALLLFLSLEPSLAKVSVTTKCNRLDSKFLKSLPAFIQEPVLKLISTHGPAIESMYEKFTGNFNQSPDQVSFLELSRSTGEDCVILGMIATVCVLVSTFAVYQYFVYRSYFHKAGFLGLGLSHGNDAGWDSKEDDEASSAFRIRPSGFNEEEKKLFQDYLMGHQVPDALIPKFQAREQLEKKAYEQFLGNSLYMKDAGDKKMGTQVLLPTLLYALFHVAAYYMAFDMGHDSRN
eukprot:c2515_g1_i2.p1 GENE.c2515_g1_i2~~c2515_g1_i2.p1  ORF type:complete len:240 (+),score=61.83 c2515_g1_i2:661-1380(+)